MEETKLTPMIEQYLNVKRQHPDALLFFRLGDFYEMFFDDAEKASQILDIALTSRNKGEPDSVPLCGVPHHSVAPYVHKLLEAGHKVAICEQVEDPAQAKGIVRREVVRVITPGTVPDDGMVESGTNCFLAAVSVSDGRYGLAVADVTTGEFRMTELGTVDSVQQELTRVGAKEILAPRGLKEAEELSLSTGALFNSLDPSEFERGLVERKIQEIGLWEPDHASWPVALEAAGALVGYLQRNRVGEIHALGRLRTYRLESHLLLDDTARRHLEIFETVDGDRKGSLFSVLDRTVTSMGSRKLRFWLKYPLQDVDEIERRLDAVEELYQRPDLQDGVREQLQSVQDLERLRGRILGGRALPRDLIALGRALRGVPHILEILGSLGSELLARSRTQIHPLPRVVEELKRALVEGSSLRSDDTSPIREGYSPELDQLREESRGSREWIARLETEERRRTGIASLKIRYNKVYGYYIEVTKANLHLVPGDYSRKQSLVGAERFVTPGLKEKESRLAQSELRMRQLEAQLVDGLVEMITEHEQKLLETAEALGVLDVLQAFAQVALRQGYVRPIVDEGTALALRDGRHPVIEALEPSGKFVPNDCFLDSETHQIMILTGPNMAGKSTYLRQVALTVLMAQLGSFVPASEAKIGIVDRIFTRVGAGDRLSLGDSTFMVEMKEVAEILRSATPRSLIILDEVGRGTSTFDGISIAWSVVEHLHDHPPIRSKTLFATHFHELTELALTKPGVRNYNVGVKEWGGQISFLRKILPGGTSRSYGIHVARLAGLPPAVVERASEILSNLERGELAESGFPRLAARRAAGEDRQLNLFDEGNPFLDGLRKLDVNQMTPLEALQQLNLLVEEVKRK